MRNPCNLLRREPRSPSRWLLSMLLLLVVAAATPVAALPTLLAAKVNCSAVIDCEHCACKDNTDLSQCAAFSDDCSGRVDSPHCQWDLRKATRLGSDGCVPDVKCGVRTMQDCVCLMTPGSGSHCLWSNSSTQGGQCVDRWAWEGSGSKCGKSNELATCEAIGPAAGDAFSCSWGKVCTQTCAGRGGAQHCCAWGDRCSFVPPQQPRCNGLPRSRSPSRIRSHSPEIESNTPKPRLRRGS